MSYRDLVSTMTVLNEEEREDLYNESSRVRPSGDYEFTRRGMPTRPVKRASVENDIKMAVSHFYEYGYGTPPSRFHDKNFERALFSFRCCLDMWESIDIPKSMSKDEIYFRCLTEGPSFTEWVKKARSSTLRYLTSETNTHVEDEYLLECYEGYDSMFHERMLIHWDDTDVIDDLKYAFIPEKETRGDEFRKRVKRLFRDFRIDEIDFRDSIDMLKELKNSVMYDPTTKKTSLMRHFWSTEINDRGSYYSARRVVPVQPAGTRDTGVGDPGTILKVKQLNQFARAISERLPYSANAPVDIVNKRLRRVLKKNSFLHLDFKKFGLTFPRALMNIMIEEIGEVSGYDLSHLLIKDFFVEIDGDVYSTRRGTMLGWLDSINSLCVCAILHHTSSHEELGFDFITFNDDVEISRRCGRDKAVALEMLRMVCISELASFDIIISQDKTYGSSASIFLEKYNYFGEYDLDMSKRQLSLKLFANSACTTYKWYAKLLFAMGHAVYRNEYIEDRCLQTSEPEFCPEEKSMSLWSGGWFIRKINGLDDSFVECDKRNFILGMELEKFKLQKYSTPIEKVGSPEAIYNSVESRAYNSYSSEAHVWVFKEPVEVANLNDDLDIIKSSFEELCFRYEGRDDSFPTRAVWVIGRSLQALGANLGGLVT